MDIERAGAELKERKVVRRGLLAGIAALGAAGMMKLTGADKAEAAVTNLTYPTAFGDGVITNTAGNGTVLQSTPAGGTGFTVLKVQNFKIADAIQAIGGPGSLGNAGGSGVVATGGPNTTGSFSTPSAGGDAMTATGGSATGGVGPGGKGLDATGGAGSSGNGGIGVEGTGGSPSGTGVRGFGGGTAGSQGIGVDGRTNSSSAAVLGVNIGSGPAVRGLGNGGPGGSVGVQGESTLIAVKGIATGNGIGVQGESALVAVKGVATGNGLGVVGLAVNNFGVYGASTNYVGLWGESATQVGLSAVTNGPGQPALYILNTNAGAAKFGALIDGNVFISGDLQVAGGNKNAVVPHPDGSLRALYCQESPEAWFEDFGRGQLVGGVARVNIDPDFAALVLRTGYYVFLTPESPVCNGLAVSQQDTNGFEVRELNGGAHSLAFAYRIVAKRKDVAAPRLAKVDPKLAARPASVVAAMAAQNAGTSPLNVPNLPTQTPPAPPQTPPAPPAPNVPTPPSITTAGSGGQAPTITPPSGPLPPETWR